MIVLGYIRSFLLWDFLHTDPAALCSFVSKGVCYPTMNENEYSSACGNCDCLCLTHSGLNRKWDTDADCSILIQTHMFISVQVLLKWSICLPCRFLTNAHNTIQKANSLPQRRRKNYPSFKIKKNVASISQFTITKLLLVQKEIHLFDIWSNQSSITIWIW